MIKKVLLLVVVFAMSLSACAPAPAAAPAELISINICYSAATLTQSTVWYAKENGLFEKYGLDVTLFQMAGGTKAVTALLSGDVAICQMAANSVINAVAAGQDPVMIGGLYNSFQTAIVAKPGISTADELRGTVLGVSKAGSSTFLAARLALKALGLEAGTDVTLLEVGEEAERLAALQAGQVDAIMTSPPFIRPLLEQGYTVLYDMGKTGIPYAHTGMATTRKYLAENRPVVVAFMKAMMEAAVLMKTDEEGTKAVLAQYLGMDLAADGADLSDGYNNVIKPYVQELPYINYEGLQTLLDYAIETNPDAAGVTIDQFVDESVVKELDEGGFISSLKK